MTTPNTSYPAGIDGPPPPPGQAADTSPGDGHGPSRKRFVVVVGVIGALVLSLIGAAAAVWIWLGGGGPQPADALPDYMDFYVRIDGDPSASQKIEIYRLLRQVPDLEDIFDAEENQDFRELIMRGLIESCDALEFDEMEKWLGNRIGVGLHFEDEWPTIAIVLQVRDEDAASQGIDDFFDCWNDRYGLAFHRGYAVITEDRRAARRLVEDAQQASLADRHEFREAFDVLGDPGVISIWASRDFFLDPEAGFHAFAQGFIDGFTMAMADDFGAGGVGNVRVPEDFAERAFSPVDSVALALRANDGALELAGTVVMSRRPDLATTYALERLPADTVIGSAVGRQSDSIPVSWNDFARYISLVFEIPVAQIEADIARETPFVVPDDYDTLFGSELVSYLGPRNVERIFDEEWPDVDMAYLIRSRHLEARDLLERAVRWLKDVENVEVATAEVVNGLAVGTTQAAADGIADFGRLGESDVFKRVIPRSGELVHGGFIDIGTFLDAFAGTGLSREERWILDALDPLEALGYSAWVDGNAVVFSARLSFR